MKKSFTALALVASLGSLALPAQAHRAWVLPAATVLSSDDAWVTFDAAISNDIFHPDHHAMNLGGLKVTGPEGKSVKIQNAHSGKYRSTFDLNLASPGTYKVYSYNGGLSASWTEDGKRKRWPGRGQEVKPGDFEKQVPQDADDLKVYQRSRRMETFVTAGKPSTDNLQATQQGLELIPETHPNDLYAGEIAKFRFLIDGEPAEGVEISVIPGGMRYRDSQEEMTLKTDNKGKVEIKWPRAGMYFLEAGYKDKNGKAPATERRGSYIATFEVLPL